MAASFSCFSFASLSCLLSLAVVFHLPTTADTLAASFSCLSFASLSCLLSLAVDFHLPTIEETLLLLMEGSRSAGVG